MLSSKPLLRECNHHLPTLPAAVSAQKRLCGIRRQPHLDVGLIHRWRCVRAMAGRDLGRYKYSRTEIDELAAMMPARLDAPVQARSRKVLKEVLEKHGLTVGSLFEDEIIDDASDGVPLFPDLSTWLDSDPAWNKGGKEDEGSQDEDGWKNIKEPLGLPVPEADDSLGIEFWMENVGTSFREQQEWELSQIFEKAMQLHHLQTKRAKNIYSATLWYGEVMRQIEVWDDYEGGQPMRIPSFVRAIFLLEENFDELNAGQDAMDSAVSKVAAKKEKALFYNWVEENLDITLGVADEPEAKPQMQMEDDAESSSLSIDELLHGTIPNAEEGEDEIYDDVVKDLLEGGGGEINLQAKEDPDKTINIPPLKGMEDINY